MRKLADTAYWIFAAGTVGSLALAAFVLVRLQPEILSQNAPSIGPFNPLFFTLVAMALTLATMGRQQHQYCTEGGSPAIVTGYVL